MVIVLTGSHGSWPQVRARAGGSWRVLSRRSRPEQVSAEARPRSTPPPPYADRVAASARAMAIAVQAAAYPRTAPDAGAARRAWARHAPRAASARAGFARTASAVTNRVVVNAKPAGRERARRWPAHRSAERPAPAAVHAQALATASTGRVAPIPVRVSHAAAPPAVEGTRNPSLATEQAVARRAPRIAVFTSAWTARAQRPAPRIRTASGRPTARMARASGI